MSDKLPGSVRDLMVAAVEHWFGRVNCLPVTIEWLSDNSSCYIADIGLEPITNAHRKSAKQWNG